MAINKLDGQSRMIPWTALKHSAVDAFVECGFSPQHATMIADYKLSGQQANKPSPIVVNADKEGPAELLIYETIGFDWMTGGGVTAVAFNESMNELDPDREINVRINSPGGDVFDAFAIFNRLKRHPGNVVVDIDGLAASAASFIAMAGNTIQMAKTSQMMIHDAWGVAMGNSADMTSMAGLLEKLDSQIADVYASRSRRKASTFRALMDDETWFTAEEAVAAKLADSVTEINATNTHDLSQFKNAPQPDEDTVTVTYAAHAVGGNTVVTETTSTTVVVTAPKVDTKQQADSVECRLRFIEVNADFESTEPAALLPSE